MQRRSFQLGANGWQSSNVYGMRICWKWPNPLHVGKCSPAKPKGNDEPKKSNDIGEIERIPDWFPSNGTQPGIRVKFSTRERRGGDSLSPEARLLGPVRLRSAVG
jgi:hypothetical protein